MREVAIRECRADVLWQSLLSLWSGQVPEGRLLLLRRSGRVVELASRGCAVVVLKGWHCQGQEL